ncbi:MAG: hypothetical protein H6809_08185, partial [Phycisphaeraceae bacterium]|nr:hypothetical protein [Phycisphaeraceae bacterium]
SGGMENTAATTLYEEASRSTADRERDLISHELAHMWFGDLLTCRTWDHLWLNEGWAVYAEVLWREERARAAAARDGLPEEIVADEAESAMLEYVLQLLRAQRRFNRARAPHDPALASNLYDDPETTFDRTDDPYNKGAGVLHMLRASLGDEVFQRATRAYINRHRDGLVESDDLRRCFEEVSGRSLERFFTQWVYRPGLPRVRLSIRWDADAHELVIEGEQTQPINADNPAYTLDVPLHITLGAERDHATRVESFALHTRTASARIPLPLAPDEVAVDPRLTIFADVRVDKDLAWWRHEAEHGPTIASRLLAAEALAAHAGATRGADERLTARPTESQN